MVTAWYRRVHTYLPSEVERYCTGTKGVRRAPMLTERCPGRGTRSRAQILTRWMRAKADSDEVARLVKEAAISAASRGVPSWRRLKRGEEQASSGVRTRRFGMTGVETDADDARRDGKQARGIGCCVTRRERYEDTLQENISTDLFRPSQEGKVGRGWLWGFRSRHRLGFCNPWRLGHSRGSQKEAWMDEPIRHSASTKITKLPAVPASLQVP